MKQLLNSIKDFLFKSNVKKDIKVPSNFYQITLEQIINYDDKELASIIFGDDMDNISFIVYQIACLTNSSINDILSLKTTDYYLIMANLEWIYTQKFIPTPKNFVRIDGVKHGMQELLEDDKIGKLIVLDAINKNNELFNRVFENDYKAILELLVIILNQFGTVYNYNELECKYKRDLYKKISVGDALDLISFFLSNIKNS